MDAAINQSAGPNFEKLAIKVLSQIPNELVKLKDTDSAYSNLGIESLKPKFDQTAVADMAYTFALMVAIEKGVDFVKKKPHPASFIGGLVAKHVTIAAIGLYIKRTFGPEVLAIFEQLRDLSDEFIALAKTDYTCAQANALSAKIAKSIADASLAAPDALLDFLGKVKSKRKKDNPNGNKCKPTDKEIEKCYEQKTSHFKGLGLTAQHIAAIEENLGASNICSGK